MTKFIEGTSIYSGLRELDKKILEWLKWDKNEATTNEIKNLINNNKWKDLEKRLLKRLTFGTAGLRGVMQAGFNAMNDLVVIQTAQGLSEYILEIFSPEEYQRGIVIGYDGRHNSKRFAELSANIFVNKNITVWLYSKTVATPFVPFGIKEKNCLAGIMVTASHNPKEDNGYKVYWSNSAQIISPHDSNIQKYITKNLEPIETSWNLDKLKSPLVKDPFEEMFKLYFEKLLRNIPTNLIENYNKNSKIKFIYSAMHGVGYPFVEKGFEIAKLQPVLPVKEQRDPDPEFPTVKFPNPEEGKSSLELSIKLANFMNCDIILANDPDADRLACAERTEFGDWKVFTGNELGSLLGWWSIQCYKMQNGEKCDLSKCYLLASTVSSKMLKSMSKIDGFNFEETLTGFKWMGNKSVELMKNDKTVLFAFEEAIGFMFSPVVLDKDGISAAIHLATMATYLYNHEHITLQQKLVQLYLTYGYHTTITSYFLCYEPETIVSIFERIRNFNGKGKYPNSIKNDKYRIKYVRDLTTGHDTSQPDGIALFPASKNTQMVTFTFENGVVLTLRTSGTEPKIKYYAEMCGEPGNSNFSGQDEILTEIIETVIDDFLQPTKNNIIPRSD